METLLEIDEQRRGITMELQCAGHTRVACHGNFSVADLTRGSEVRGKEGEDQPVKKRS